MNGRVENGGNKTMSSLRIRSLKMGSCNRHVSKHVKFWLQLITVGVVRSAFTRINVTAPDD